MCFSALESEPQKLGPPTPTLQAENLCPWLPWEGLLPCGLELVQQTELIKSSRAARPSQPKECGWPPSNVRKG